MAAQRKTLSPDEFREGLERDDLVAPLALDGMAKMPTSKGKASTFLFTMTGCESWIEIPLDVIENVEVLGSAPCEGHSHPFVRVEFKKPDASTAWMFSLIASALSPTSAREAIYGPETMTARGDRLTPSPNPTVQCIKACRDAHIGDPIGYMICAINCA